MSFNKQHPLYREDLEDILKTNGLGPISGKTVFITGATGLIGTCLIDALMLFNQRNPVPINIIAVGRNRNKAQSRLGEYFSEPYFSFLEQDVQNPFPPDIRPDFILHCASLTHPRDYSTKPIETIWANLAGTKNALDLALRTQATVLLLSSVEIYGNSIDGSPFREDDTGKLNLATSRAAYPEAKRSAEALCQAYAAQHGLVVKIARLSRVFGPTLLDSDSKASSQFIRHALSGEDIVLKSNGEQQYSYTYVSDAVSAIIWILLNGESATAYNVANPDCNVRLRDFAAACASWAGKNIRFVIPDDTERNGYSIAQNAILDPSRLLQRGYRYRRPFDVALRRTLTILS